MLFTTAWMQLHRWQVQQDLKAILLSEVENPNLLRLKLSTAQAKELHWEDEREFEWNGTLYDLVQLKTTGDTLHLLCWPDRLETGLGLQLDKLLSHPTDPQQQNRQLCLLDFLKSLPGLSFASQNAGTSFTEGKQPPLGCFIPTRFATPPPAPPPECCFLSEA